MPGLGPGHFILKDVGNSVCVRCNERNCKFFFTTFVDAMFTTSLDALFTRVRDVIARFQAHACVLCGCRTD